MLSKLAGSRTPIARAAGSGSRMNIPTAFRSSAPTWAVPALYQESSYNINNSSPSTTRFFSTSSSSDARLIDGKKIASFVRSEVKIQSENLRSRGVIPGLAVVLVGNRPDSATYVISKQKVALECGFNVVDRKLPEDVPEHEVLKVIEELNERPDVHGILVQLPLPGHISEQRVLKRVKIDKDVDGFSGHNIGNLTLKGGDPLAHPCTPAGCMELLRQCDIDPKGKKCVILGRSNIVGTPLALLMLHSNATVTICHSHTADLKAECQQADILVAAIGKPELVKGDWVKPGATLIDVGINIVENIPGPDATEKEKKKKTKIVGDIEFSSCLEVAGRITPVPGGVGPMTIAMLLQNTLSLAERAMILEAQDDVRRLESALKRHKSTGLGRRIDG